MKMAQILLAPWTYRFLKNIFKKWPGNDKIFIGIFVKVLYVKVDIWKQYESPMLEDWLNQL